MNNKVAYTEYLPSSFIQPRWLSLIIEIAICACSLILLNCLFVWLHLSDNLAEGLIIGALIALPVIIPAFFYSVRVYATGKIKIIPINKSIEIEDITEIKLIPIRQLFFTLNFLECKLKNGENTRILVNDIPSFIAELQRHNPDIKLSDTTK